MKTGKQPAIQVSYLSVRKTTNHNVSQCDLVDILRQSDVRGGRLEHQVGGVFVDEVSYVIQRRFNLGIRHVRAIVYPPQLGHRASKPLSWTTCSWPKQSDGNRLQVLGMMSAECLCNGLAYSCPVHRVVNGPE